MQVEQLYLVKSQQPQAPLHTAPHLLPAELASMQVAVRLGRKHKPCWQPAKLAKHHTQPAFTLAIAIGSRRIDEVDRAGKDRTDSRQGLFFFHAVGERLGHVAERGAADAERRYR